MATRIKFYRKVKMAQAERIEKLREVLELIIKRGYYYDECIRDVADIARRALIIDNWMATQERPKKPANIKDPD